MDTVSILGESSNSSRFLYDVFLSFRGEDTRKAFTGHLYSRLCQVGINTFIDDEELRKGEVISRELENAIENSRVSIVVFSRNYASSSWCLEELIKILECKDKLKQVVLPVFYHVDPSHVRKQTEGVGEALANLKEKSFGAQRMEKWTAALTEAANLSGWDLQNVDDGHESKLIEIIVQRVRQEINRTPLDVAWHPVGIDSRFKEIELLLQKCEDEVRMVGIYGIGGIGKTTLAKAIYNQTFRGDFDGSCFLPNVRLEANLVKLQEKLLDQILKTKDTNIDCVDAGVNLIKWRLGSKKVLIVLDDLDERRQLESLARERSWFGAGSLVIITTRDQQLLSRLSPKERYMAKLLNDNEGMRLFSRHAFNDLPMPQEYIELAKGIIKYSHGLPLALVTLGSHLQGRPVEEWRCDFERLRAIPHTKIHDILKISFDGLDDDIQRVFLDIAGPFYGFTEPEVIEILNACGFHPESAIATLVRKCLLQRIDRDRLGMHDLVRDMGREIVRRESPQDPGKRSRLFDPREVRDVLRGNLGSKKVEVLMVDPRALQDVNLSTEAFKKMKKLRVLKIDELDMGGDHGELPKQLRWLSWRKCLLNCIPSYFPAERLVILDMRWSKIQELGLDFQRCTSLKKLDLCYCKNLASTPNFKGSRSLEILLLDRCSSLTEIHQSIGNLDRLIQLNLTHCIKLTGLPSSICLLKSLQFLDLTGCSSMQTLPAEIGYMQSLRRLNAVESGIKELPGSVKMLKNLSFLEVGSVARWSFLPSRVNNIESLASLKFLQTLRLSYYGLSSLPREIGDLSYLEILDLRGNSFHCLPFGFSKLRLLRILDLKDSENLHTLPSVSNLQHLQVINLAGCRKLVKITGLENLPSIRKLEMAGCPFLENPLNEGFFVAPALAFQSRKDGQHEDLLNGINIKLHCNEIPEWCNSQVTASYICFTMPTHNNGYKFLGMILWSICNPTTDKFACLSFSIDGKWDADFADSVLLRQHVELSYVHYSEPFDGRIKGGEKIQIRQVKSARKIGIHLLYLDQQGNVTSLPAVVDHQMNRSQYTNGVPNSEDDSIPAKRAKH